MGNNWIRGLRELPKLNQQLKLVKEKRIEAERQLKLLKDDMDKNAVVVEKQRENAILQTTKVMDQLKKEMDSELNQVKRDFKVEGEDVVDDLIKVDNKKSAIRRAVKKSS